MTTYLGNFLLSLSLFFAISQFFVSKKNKFKFITITVNGLLISSLLSFGLLMYSHIISDFSILNVFQNSHTTIPLLYKISGVWGNHEGSMLLWILVLTIFNYLIFKLYNKNNSIFIAKTLEIQAFITTGFILFTVLTSNPFQRMIPEQDNGLGFNPILQDPALAIHPPLLYIGYVGLSAAFSIGVATLALNNIKKILRKKQLGKIISVSAEYGQYLPDWRPSHDYKKDYSASKLLGGGIIHDSSHELDYLIWLFGNPKEIQSNYIKTDILKTDVEAIAEIILKFKNNTLGRIHLDFIRREYKRSVEILCEYGIISWSLKEGTVKIFNAKNQKWKIIQKSEPINQMYISEMGHIINCLKQNKSSKIIHLENGINSQKFSDLIMKSGKNGNKIKI